MHECLLCSRDMKVSEEVFGKGCVRNIYKFLEWKMPKKVLLREETLYNNTMKKTSNRLLNKKQKVWLFDRYLTYQYLEKIPYGKHNLIQEQIETDIKNIRKIKNEKDLVSNNKIKLKQAYDLYKKVTKFQKGIEELKKGNFTDEESIKFIIASVSFAFHMSKNSSQYEKSVFKAMQYAFWQTVIEVGGRYAEFDISADLLQHSLEEKPSNLVITEGKIVEEVINDKSFQTTINSIIEKYGKDCNEFEFDSQEKKEFPISFNTRDLYFAIHFADIKMKAKKCNDKWDLEIKLHDRYDYSKFKFLKGYYKDTDSILKSIFSSTLYNFAWSSIKLGVIKEYNIDIQFETNTSFEVMSL